MVLVTDQFFQILTDRGYLARDGRTITHRPEDAGSWAGQKALDHARAQDKADRSLRPMLVPQFRPSAADADKFEEMKRHE